MPEAGSGPEDPERQEDAGPLGAEGARRGEHADSGPPGAEGSRHGEHADTGGQRRGAAAEASVGQEHEPRPGQGHVVAPADAVEVLAVDVVEEAPPVSLWRAAWHRLRRNPLFLLSAVLIVFVVAVAVFPGLFTDQDPRLCLLDRSMGPSGPGHIFGFDLQGCDIYARTVYGARASVLTGVCSALGLLLLGGTLGALSGFFGGLLDAVVSRVGEVFFALPLLLAAIVLMQLLHQRTVLTVVAIMVAFTWPQAARVARASVIEARNSEYVTAARALGVSKGGVLVRHVLPNAAGPLIVIASIWLGVYIVTEATLSYLGVGLPPSVIGWGSDIATGRQQLRSGHPILFYPATALAITVLSFILLGDALRDALDPKARTR
ncbi:ABC transporter permease [Nocardia stercoris]|uniref:ABC transporter permease subunit n=1 Tax=Nocardia stercoris TaxID=2483361 RepID=A0A3M2KUG8_9NOCA|nr:ABC transporter permease [Nocardia stercoris]RMI29302.1 ABC transporter permease subunit [Nocardia stercoris]